MGKDPKKNTEPKRFVLRKKAKRPTLVFVDMEIMRTFASSLGKISASVCFLVATSSGLFASDVVLQKVPQSAPDQASPGSSQSRLGPQASFALINYSLKNAHKARALYVSSGGEITQAGNMIDAQAATSFGFSAEDRSPTAVIDLGKACKLQRLSATYSARPGSVDFYVLQTLPGTTGDNAPDTLTLDSNAFAGLKPVGSAIDDGTQGSASINIPATTGRYVMLRWNPAARSDTPFTVAEVTASGPARENLIASNRNFSNNQTTADGKDIGDAKDMGDSKDMGDNKDIPEDAVPPAEGPPPNLPNPPPFTFIPQLVPVSN
jgi:hypothetical protein